MPHLTPTEREALTRFKQRVQQAFPDQVDELRLFGSKARGDAAKHSDVDVLVVLDRGSGTLGERRRVYEIGFDIALNTGVAISPKVLSRQQYDELRSWGEPILLNIEREGIPL